MLSRSMSYTGDCFASIIKFYAYFHAPAGLATIFTRVPSFTPRVARVATSSTG